MCAEGIKKTPESFTVPVCVSYVNSLPSGTIQILTTAQTFRQRISHHPIVLVAHGAVTKSKDTTTELHSARCCEFTSLTMQNAASGMSTQFLVTPPEFCITSCLISLWQRPHQSHTIQLFLPRRLSHEFRAHDFHKLHDLWSQKWFRHQVGGVRVRAHHLRDEPL